MTNPPVRYARSTAATPYRWNVRPDTVSQSKKVSFLPASPSKSRGAARRIFLYT